MLDLSKVNLENLDPDERAVFEWQYGYHEKFSFHWHLWEAIKIADSSNLSAFTLGFPIEIQGLMKYRAVPNWWPEVERKAVGS